MNYVIEKINVTEVRILNKVKQTIVWEEHRTAVRQVHLTEYISVIMYPLFALGSDLSKYFNICCDIYTA